MNSKLLVTMSWLCLIASTSVLAQSQEFLDNKRSQYEAFAGEPVDKINREPLKTDRWEYLGESTIVYYTSRYKAYLLTLDVNCERLSELRNLDFRNSRNNLKTKLDAVYTQNQRCEIASIRPVDYKAMRAARHNESAS